MIYNKLDLGTFDNYDLLESIDYINEDELSYTPNLVNVRYNYRNDQEMISLESMVDYSVNNKLTNFKYILSTITEANNLHENKIAFSVKESSLYKDDTLVDTVKAIKENGYLVNIEPISSKSIYYTKLQEALKLDKDYDSLDESYYLKRYLNENIFEDISDGVSNGVNSVKNYFGKNVDTMKKFATDNRDYSANRLASITRTIKENYAKLKGLTGDARNAVLRQINKLTAMAASLKNKISSGK